MASVRIEEPPTAIELGPVGWSQFHKNRLGLQLCRYFWPAVGTPKGVLLLIHGHGNHTCFAFLAFKEPGKPYRYEGSWVESWNKAGYSVCGQDFQGCGRSEGARGLRAYVESYDDYVTDVLDFTESLSGPDARGFQNFPIFLCGASLGGCVAVTTAHRGPERFRGVILLAPMLSLEEVAKKGWNPYFRPLLTLFNYLFPTLPLAETNKNDKYPDIQEMYDKDAACWHDKTRLRNASEYLRATEELGREAPNMRFPFLCVHGLDDTMCDWHGSKRFFDVAGSRDKTLELVEDGWHVLVHEPGNEKVLELVTEWLKQRCDG